MLVGFWNGSFNEAIPSQQILVQDIEPANSLQLSTKMLADAPTKPSPFNPRQSFKLTLLIAMLISFSVYSVIFLTSSLDSDNSEWRKLLLSLLLSPMAASIRYTLSYHNKDWPRIPLYTLQVNVIGSFISVVCYIISLQSITSPTTLLVGAISVGFAGCLSTVSTFVNECRLLRGKTCYHYIYVTFLLSQVLAISLLAVYL